MASPAGSDTSLYVVLIWVAPLVDADTSLYVVLLCGSAGCALLYVHECLILLQITELSHGSRSELADSQEIVCLLALSFTNMAGL